jgi:hypothetical protein
VRLAIEAGLMLFAEAVEAYMRQLLASSRGSANSYMTGTGTIKFALEELSGNSDGYLPCVSV